MDSKFDKVTFFHVKNILILFIKKRPLIVCLVIVIQLLLFMSLTNAPIHLKFINPPNCYLDKVWKDGKTLQEVCDNDILSPSSKNVFFHETSCIDDGIIKLNARQACAIESAAILNPDYEIFVLFVSQVGFRNLTELPIIDALLSYPNIHFNFLNLTRYSQKTPLENWIKTKALFRSKFVVSHASDVLRFLSLWKYGGTYLDLDVIMLKPLKSMKDLNYAGAEYDFSVAVGIIHLEGDSGHEIADLCVKDLAVNFKGDGERAVNGPGLFTRVLHTVCGTDDVEKMIYRNICKNFRVLPTQACYNINWYDRKKFYREEFADEVFASISNSLMTHVWNHHSPKGPLEKDGKTPYVLLAKKYCPKTLDACETF